MSVDSDSMQVDKVKLKHTFVLRRLLRQCDAGKACQQAQGQQLLLTPHAVLTDTCMHVQAEKHRCTCLIVGCMWVGLGEVHANGSRNTVPVWQKTESVVTGQQARIGCIRLYVARRAVPWGF